jgi:hypothetical protein
MIAITVATRNCIASLAAGTRGRQVMQLNDNLYGGHNQDIIASQLIAEFFECTPAVVSTADVHLDLW